MAAKKFTDHDPLAVALLATVLVWIIFDSFALGMIAGLAGYFLTQKSQKESDRETR